MLTPAATGSSLLCDMCVLVPCRIRVASPGLENGVNPIIMSSCTLIMLHLLPDLGWSRQLWDQGTSPSTMASLSGSASAYHLSWPAASGATSLWVHDPKYTIQCTSQLEEPRSIRCENAKKQSRMQGRSTVLMRIKVQSRMLFETLLSTLVVTGCKWSRRQVSADVNTHGGVVMHGPFNTSFRGTARRYGRAATEPADCKDKVILTPLQSRVNAVPYLESTILDFLAMFIPHHLHVLVQRILWATID